LQLEALNIPKDDLVAFDVLDVLGGLVELRRSSATLDGSIPLRAAQACQPLLDGNRFGHQLVLSERLELVRGARGPKLARVPEPIRRAHAGAIPRLFAEGLLDRVWEKQLCRGLVTGRGALRGELTLFTGLLVRPRPGLWLRLSAAGNRRNVLCDVTERWVRDSDRLVPLLLTLRPGPEARFPLVLSGELATLAPFDPRVRVVESDLAEARDIGRAHLSFFDQAYFEEKKRAPTQKYKRLLARANDAPSDAPAELRVVRAGSSMTRVERIDGFEAIAFDNGVPFEATFDGHECRVTPDPRALREHATRTRNAWRAAFDEAELGTPPGALLYFEKYLTPHQPGEPYFFVKPPALVATPPGWSLLIDGTAARGRSVLRGVTASDVFHAAPAVIRLDHPGRRVRVAQGETLARLYPFPRALFAARFEPLDWRFAPRLGT
jgi:hypothetical protein